MSTFRGRLFAPTLPGAGVGATAYWDDDGTLVVCSDNRQWNAGVPQVVAGGFNATVVRLEWRAADGPCALCLDTATDLATCQTTAPAGVAAQFAGAGVAQRRVEHRFRAGWVVLATILLLPLFALLLFLYNAEPIAEWAVARIPAAEEARLGDLVLAQVRLQHRLIEEGPAVAAVRALGEQLNTGTLHHYRWFVVDDPTLNAFAAPGGVVVVNSGLLRAVTAPEELAGVLAHEIAHAELRHSLTVMVKGLGLQTLAALVLGDWSGSAVAEAARQLTELAYSRDAERAADAEGLRRLIAARIDPSGMVRFFERLQQETKLAPPAFLSTHPDTVERLAQLRRAVAGQSGPWQRLTVDLAAVRAALPNP